MHRDYQSNMPDQELKSVEEGYSMRKVGSRAKVGVFVTKYENK
jgi:hypothetical protein